MYFCFSHALNGPFAASDQEDAGGYWRYTDAHPPIDALHLAKVTERNLANYIKADKLVDSLLRGEQRVPLSIAPVKEESKR